MFEAKIRLFEFGSMFESVQCSIFGECWSMSDEWMFDLTLIYFLTVIATKWFYMNSTCVRLLFTMVFSFRDKHIVFGI